MTILRHSKIAVAMDVYSQVSSTSTKKALTRLGNQFGGGACEPRCRTLLEHGHERGPYRPAERSLTWVETRGLEPLTPCLQSRCATNCATSPSGLSPDLTPVQRTESVASAHRSCSAWSACILRQTAKTPAPASTAAMSFFTYGLQSATKSANTTTWA